MNNNQADGNPILSTENTNCSTNKSTDSMSKRIITSVLLSFCFSFNLFVFAPLESYISNANDFWFSISNIVPFVIILFISFFIISFLLCSFLPRILRNIITALIFAGTVGLYIQGNFLVRGYPTMTGEPIDWSTMINRGIINTVFWVVLFALVITLMILNKQIFRTIVRSVSLIIAGIQLVTLGSMLITNDLHNDGYYYLSEENMFDISEKDNIIVIVSDTFEASYLKKALERNPELSDDLKDFTLYEDASGVSTLTYLSMATILTGNIFPLDADSADGMRACFENTDFYDKLHDYGYEVNYYTDSGFMDASSMGRVDNLAYTSKISNTKASYEVSKLLYKFSLYKCAPHFMKQRFVVNTSRFGEVQQMVDYPSYTFDDALFYNKLQSKEIHANRNKKQYILYHLAGVHAPYDDLDRNLQPIAYKEGTLLEEMRYEKSLGQIKILKEFLSQLKKSGAYDNTTIIYTADHGNLNRYNPVFMVKPAGADKEFTVSSAPVSIKDDFIGFIEDLASGKGNEARLYQIPENVQRDRYVYNYFAGKYMGVNKSRTKILIKGRTDDLDSYQIIEDEYNTDTEIKDNYKLGDKISYESNVKNAIINGVFYEKETLSKTASVTVKFDSNVSTDLTAYIKLLKIYGDSQRFIAYIGDTVVYNETITQAPTDISFIIPKEACESGSLTVKFEFPDAHKRIEDTVNLGWFSFEAFSIDSIKFFAKE